MDHATAQNQTAEPPASFAGRGHSRLVALVRAVPIRWRILSIAALNSAVVVVLVALIWNGVQVLGSAWDDVRQVRESDRILATLESETGHLQNLIHRYINQPSTETSDEISRSRETVLGTLKTRAATDPMLSGSVQRLEHVTERFLNGFGELRTVQAKITKTYEEEVLSPARDMAGLYSIIEGATGHRDALIWPSLGKSREAFTAMLVAANSYYLSLATASAEEASRNTETIQQTIPVMNDLADNDLQRMALQRLNTRTKALGEGLTKLSAQLTNRTELLRDAIDASQAEASNVIDELSVKMRQREQKAQETFDQTLADISRKVLSIAVIFMGIIITAGVLIALSIRLPLQQILAAMHAITSGDLNRKVQGIGARDEVGEMARAVEVFRENAIAKRKTEDELRASKEKAENALEELNTAQQNLIDAERLAALGGKRVVDRVDCDLDFADPAARWIGDAVKALAPAEAARGTVIEVDFSAKPAPEFVEAEVIDHIDLNSSRSDKETIHLELAFDGPAPPYKPGDSLDIVPENDPELVDAILKASGLAHDNALHRDLTKSRDITTLSIKTLETYAASTGHQYVKVLVETGEAKGWIAGRQLIDLIEHFPIALTAEQLRALTRPLAPRAYSIASSRREVGEEIHLLISAVRYETHGRARKGVASNHVAERLKKGSRLRVKLRPNRHFALPAPEHDIIMVGPGTGVAPFRAFVQERRATKASGRNWLFFGDRSFTHDFLYQLEWQDALKDGSLAHMDVAFSRDQLEKVYVQHRIWEKRQELVEWLDGGAHFYVCGDMNAMAKDVRAMLVRAYADVKVLTPEAAEQAVQELERSKRYLQDVY